MSDPTKRLFIAIDFPDSVKTYLRGLTKRLPEMSAVFSKDFHLTLKFLGDCTEARQQKIEKLLRHIPFGPHTITLSGFSTFGGKFPPSRSEAEAKQLLRPKGAPCVLWVGVESFPSLVQTAMRIEKNMSHLGFPPENRFVPHCTIARIKHMKNPPFFLEKLKSISVRPLRFSVTRFHLFESRLSSRGERYKILASFPFSAERQKRGEC